MSFQSVIIRSGFGQQRFAALRETVASLTAGTAMLGAFAYFIFGMIESEIVPTSQATNVQIASDVTAVSFLPRTEEAGLEFQF